MKVLLLTHPMSPVPFADALAQAAPGLDLRVWDKAMDDEALAQVEVLLAWRLPVGLAPRMPRLRWVCSVAAGVEKLLVPDLPAAVAVSRTVDPGQAFAIAQYVTLMALRHARRLPRHEGLQRERVWRREPSFAARHRVLVLGTGATGSAIAQMLSAVGFEVQGWSRRRGGEAGPLLAAADIVVCALPLTAQTERFFDAGRLAQMKPGAYLVNIARGAHVVEADLIDAVRSGHLAGAALDVQSSEPLPADHALWAVDGITITPHIAGEATPQTVARQFAEGLAALQAGRPLPRQVDRAAGY
ncbi:NAD(P)-dependent oxidoreductase [Aquabacterium sp. J223]|uniref:NAD(P)-dependent oxidoreductase n=1 Tax=Aquabacterium sp. J223 TaxID=2898431 RepID=UPI0021AD8092|nr:NAD(P)-dependent oxidoreductase [Aquabacterium sp. J223]UUX93972.1 glyoxylate/hydroxypyruvate reductase A [Aquabacterium sp. J223]